MGKKTQFDYRQFYKDYYNIDFGDEFEIHHIDKDRSNNDISNLILLPNELHELFHANELGWVIEQENTDRRIFEDWYFCSELKKYADVAYKIGFWASFKRNLDEFKQFNVNPLNLDGYSYPSGIVGR